MARFYLTGVNSLGNTISASGSSRGQDAHLRGWNLGVEVVAQPKPLDSDRDMFTVYLTTGSNGSGSRFALGEVLETSDGDRVFVLSGEAASKLDPKYRTLSF